MPGTLYVVATPIGNLEDITLRALRVLREASAIAAEDTRRTSKLLTHHGIATRTVSFHEHNAHTRVPQLLGWLREGSSIALVTDAGTPGVSDPGMELVHACALEGIPIDPVPGVSASLTAAVASGFPLIPLTIYGFAPYRSNDRKRWLGDIANVVHTLTFFEAPHRIRQTLTAAAELLGERQIVVGRELTKVHQQFLRGNAAQVLETMAEPRGEYTVVVGPAQVKTEASSVSDEDIALEFLQMTDSEGQSRRERITTLAKQYGRSVKDVYALIERHK